MDKVIEWVQNPSEWWTVVTSVIALAAAIAALTPTPKDDNWVAKARKVVDWLGLNVFHAKNKQ